MSLTGDIQTLRPGSSVPIAGPVPSSDITGTTTNDNAPSGSIGQFVTATKAAGAAVSLTDATPANVVSISLPAGDWDVSAMVDAALAGGTLTDLSGGISLASATLPSQAGGAGLGTDALAVNDRPTTTLTGVLQLAIPPVRVLLAGTTTVYLVASAGFSAGTVAVYGTLRARRVR